MTIISTSYVSSNVSSSVIIRSFVTIVSIFVARTIPKFLNRFRSFGCFANILNRFGSFVNSIARSFARSIARSIVTSIVLIAGFLLSVLLPVPTAGIPFLLTVVVLTLATFLYIRITFTFLIILFLFLFLFLFNIDKLFQLFLTILPYAEDKNMMRTVCPSIRPNGFFSTEVSFRMSKAQL